MKFNIWNLITNFLLCMAICAVLLTIGIMTNSPAMLSFLVSFGVGMLSPWKTFEVDKKDA